MAKHSEQFPLAFRIAEKLLIFSGVIVPLFFLGASYRYGAPKTFLISAIACLLIALLGTLALRDRSYLPRLPKLAIVLGVYVLWIIVTAMTAVNSNLAWWSTFDRGDGVISLLAAIIIAVAAIAIIQKKDIRRPLACALAWGGIIAVVGKYLQLVWPDQTFLIGEGSTLGNSSFAGAYLIFPLAMAAYIAATTAVRRTKIWWSMVVIFIFTSPFYIQLFSTHTNTGSWLGDARAATLAIVIGTITGAIFFYSFASKKILRYVANSFAVIGLVGAAIVAYVIYTPGSSLQDRFIEAASPTRILYADIARMGIADRPIFGWGTGNFPYIYQEYFNPISMTREYLREGWIDRPHNLILEIAANGGIPVLALYLAFYGGLLVMICVYVRRGYIERKIGAIFFGAFIAYFVQNLFLFETAATQYAFYLSAALLISYAPFQKSSNEPLITGNAVRPTTAAGLWIAAVVGIYHLSFLPAEEAIKIQRMRLAPSAVRTEQVTAIFSISPMGSIVDESRIIEGYAAGYLAKLPTYDTEARRIISNELIEYLAIIDERKAGGTDYLRLHLAGATIASDIVAYSADKQTTLPILQKAHTYATHAINISPRNQLGYLELAKTYILAGDSTAAIRFLQLAVDLEPRHTDAHRILLTLIQGTGNQSLFKEKLQEAQTAIPDFAYVTN